ERISVDNLLQAMLIPSSNDAALLLANFAAGDETSFVKLMNDKAAKLGLRDTHFTNPVGWDIDVNFSTALDLVKISREFLKNPRLASIAATKETIITSADGKYSHDLTTTNKLLFDYPEVVGLK